MNSIDTKNLRDDDGRMNERVANLERIAEETAMRLGSLERKVDGLARDLAALTQTVGTLTQTVDELSKTVGKLSIEVAVLTQIVTAQGQQIAALTQSVQALTERVSNIEARLAIVETTMATMVTKEYLERALHGMTWRIIGAITLLTGAVWFASRYNSPYAPLAPAALTAPATSAPLNPPRRP
jgi:chromosome segregation ATPase